MLAAVTQQQRQHVRSSSSSTLRSSPTVKSHSTCSLNGWMQVELGTPDSSTPDQGQVQVSVECSSCASPEFKVCGWSLQSPAIAASSIRWCKQRVMQSQAVAWCTRQPAAGSLDKAACGAVPRRLSCTHPAAHSARNRELDSVATLHVVDWEDLPRCDLLESAPQAVLLPLTFHPRSSKAAALDAMLIQHVRTGGTMRHMMQLVHGYCITAQLFHYHSGSTDQPCSWLVSNELPSQALSAALWHNSRCVGVAGPWW